MKKVRKLFQDERYKLLLTCAAAAALLLTALLLPLAFRSTEEPETPGLTSAEEKRRLFADYWLLGPEEPGITVTKEDTPSQGTVRACEAVMERLVAECIDDRQLDYEAPDGSEYTRISDDGGVRVQLCRMWLEARGDWQNWLDVCFDAESGEIYYLYLSRECLSNRSRYGPLSGLNARDIADSLAEEYGWTLRWLEEGKESAAALFTTGLGTACYQIDCRSYDMLLDVKLCCR